MINARLNHESRMATPKPTKTIVDFLRRIPPGLEMFDVIEDPHYSNATRHPFGSILFIALSLLKTKTSNPRTHWRQTHLCRHKFSLSRSRHRTPSNVGPCICCVIDQLC